jgi:hypothetical protein
MKSDAPVPAMALRELLRDKVPPDVQLTHEYKSFMSLVRQENLTDVATLRAYLAQESEACTARIKALQGSNNGGTQSVHLRSLSKKYEFLKLIQDKILRYLG